MTGLPRAFAAVVAIVVTPVLATLVVFGWLMVISGDAALLIDMESDDAIEATPEYARTEYQAKIGSHIEELRTKAQAAGIDYFFLRTDRSLDEALREYFTIRQGRL